MTPNKEQVMLELLKDAWVYVQLDPRRQGVELPEFLRQAPRLVLQYGYNMPVPIHDLVIDAQGIKATLSFRRVSHSTVVPWSAVFAITDGDQRGYLWEADLPADLNLEAELGPERSQAAAEKPASAPAKLDQAAAAPGEPARPAFGSSRPGPAGKKPRPSHLKLVD
jgi:hypothetical protein